MLVIPDDLNLRIPGPTPLPEEVREALALPMIGHRSRLFSKIHAEVVEGLKELLRTANDVFVLTSSGTGGMETAIVNTLSPGDKVLSVSIGNFGARFRTIAGIYGAEIVPLDYEWGTAADPDEIGAALEQHPDVKAVLVTHNETSTGVTNPLREIAAVVKAKGDASPLLLVDAISSAGCIELETDAWNIDVLVTGSQKGWMIPPGLAFVAVSDAAWEAHKRSTMPRFYFDLTAAHKKLPADQTPWTPAVNLFYGLAVALRLMRQEGLENIWARHQQVADYTRQRVQEMGLELFADPRYASNTVTAIRAPASSSADLGHSIDVDELRQRLEQRHRVILAGGQGPLKGRIFRIGHLGNVHQADIDHALTAISEELEQLVHA